MSMVETIEGSDLLDVQKGIVCHQVNCVGVMGAGVALQIKSKWPKVFNAYLEECKELEADPMKLLGHVQDVFIREGLIVANCYGQVYPGNGLMTSYKAWDTILDKLKDLSNYFSLDLHFPWMVGCGLAGGDWEVMRKKIEHAFSGKNVKVFIHKLGKVNTMPAI